MKRDEKLLEGMIQHFGADKIPNPNQYPKQFKFLTLSYEHYLKMKNSDNKEVQKT